MRERLNLLLLEQRALLLSEQLANLNQTKMQKRQKGTKLKPKGA